ncbi:MAG: 2-amino-4-hydroxy-6-hydroxymethyldihydropteridine diphosphokinase [Gammaproteobacteria bacterium]|jgi:2-amino-4-hydroxy-6-hydroxymethyldihydropteridine diphosphokinase|nr:2-amino-4-hydroxy-6-hydroxymethyldihydropteridine diphosphokinase [Gammaproteobacteria bacterium]
MNAVAHWVPAYIGVGSNLADPVAQVRRALERLDALPGTRGVRHSPLYRNPPLGPQDQPDYVNAVAGVLTQLTPRALLGELQALETALGRTRVAGDRWGPRVIDLDLLACGAQELVEPGLVLPHPGISERNFVLFPLYDVAPGLSVPGQGTVRDMISRVDGSALVPVT